MRRHSMRQASRHAAAQQALIGIPLRLCTPAQPSSASTVPLEPLSVDPIVSLPQPERPRVPTITVGLRPHPTTRPLEAGTDGVPTRVSAVGMLLATMYATPDGMAVFEFKLEDTALDGVRVPLAAKPGPADELWKHTCFEVFIGIKGEPGYREFNFSPSGQWAAYEFRAERERNDDFRLAAAPQLRFEHDGNEAWLEARLPEGTLPPAAPGTEFELGLAAVIERADGELEYWAVQHSPGAPDFHVRDTFVLMFKTWAEPSEKSR